MTAFNPRAYQVYVQGSTKRMLSLIAKTKPMPSTGGAAGMTMTADQVADEALRSWIAASYPKVSLLIEEQDKLEKAFLKSMEPEA